MRFTRVVRSFVCATALTLFAIPAIAQDRPNILVIWGDDIGYFNVGAYNRGAMGYDTPNTLKVARCSCSRKVKPRVSSTRKWGSGSLTSPATRNGPREVT